MKMVFVLCIVVLIQAEITHAAVYNVGGTGGWTFNTVGWPKGKRFRAGDVLSKYHRLLLRELIFVWIPYSYSL